MSVLLLYEYRAVFFDVVYNVSLSVLSIKWWVEIHHQREMKFLLLFSHLQKFLGRSDSALLGRGSVVNTELCGQQRGRRNRRLSSVPWTSHMVKRTWTFTISAHELIMNHGFLKHYKIQSCSNYILRQYCQ